MRKNGFGLIQAIMIVLMLGGIMTITLKYASISARHIQDSYIREQLELFMQSSMEKALLDIGGFDRTNNKCDSSFTPVSLEKRGITYTTSVIMKKYYLFSGAGEDCSNSAANDLQIGTEESHGFVLMEVEANATKGGVLQARILRRTLQRP